MFPPRFEQPQRSWKYSQETQTVLKRKRRRIKHCFQPLQKRLEKLTTTKSKNRLHLKSELDFLKFEFKTKKCFSINSWNWNFTKILKNIQKKTLKKNTCAFCQLQAQLSWSLAQRSSVAEKLFCYKWLVTIYNFNGDESDDESCDKYDDCLPRFLRWSFCCNPIQYEIVIAVQYFHIVIAMGAKYDNQMK